MADQVKDAHALYCDAIDATRSQRKQVEEDLKFSDPSNPQQWDDTVKRQRESDPGGIRPCLVHDQIGQYIANTSGQFAQRPPAIHTIPVDSGADKRAAETLDGIIRHIEHASRAQSHYSRALLSAARCGVGYLIVRPEYTDRALNYQEPRIASEGDPLRVVFDPWSVELDGSDATFGFLLTPYSHREWERKFGKADKASFAGKEQRVSRDERESVVAAECWRIETMTRNMLIVGMPDGEEVSLTEDEYWQRFQSEQIRPPVLRQYPDKVRTVRWSVMSGAEELVKAREYTATGVGIVPMYGYVGWADGRMTYCGMARRAREPQQSYNLYVSEIREAISKAPRAPWLMPLRAIDGALKPLWDRANAEGRAYLPYIDQDDTGPVAAPSRMPMAVNLQNLVQGAQQSLMDIQASLGLYQANLGAPSNETSGIAIESRKQQGEASTSHFTAHAQASIGQVGRLIVDMIPRLIDTKRRMRILGFDLTPSSVAIDPGMSQAVQETPDGVIVNPTAGTYDVRVVVGASFSTQRQQAQAAYTEMMRANPGMTPAIAPLWAKSLDVPDADKLAQVLVAVAPPEVQAILKPQDGKPSSEQLMAQLEQMKAALQEAVTMAQEAQAECERIKAEADSKEEEDEARVAELAIKRYEAETKRLQVTGANEAQVQAIVSQMLASMLANPMPPVDGTEQHEGAEKPEAMELGGMPQEALEPTFAPEMGAEQPEQPEMGMEPDQGGEM